MPRHDPTQVPPPHPENLPHIGFDLFPPHGTAASPAITPPSGIAKPHLPASHPVLPADRPSFWRMHSPWLIPAGLFLLAIAIFQVKLYWVGGFANSLVTLPALAIFLAYRAVIGLVVCFLCMKFFDDEIGPVLPFLVQILGATAFAGALGFVIPTVGIWLVEPLVLCWLYIWLLELSIPRGAFYAIATWGITFGLILYIIARTLGPLFLMGG